MKNKGLLIFLAILAVLVIWGISTQRGLVGLDEGVKNKVGDINSQYQRRSDLIPNLVKTVEGEKNFEQQTLKDVIAARASATQIKLDPTNLTPEKLKEFEASQGQLSQALGRLMVVSEQYPNLKANEAFRKLQDELAGTENRITRARDEFNAAVKPYNTKVRAFPGSLLAGMFGFAQKGYFEAKPGSEKVPEVNFGTPATK
jgi:LemA protein